MVRLQLSARAHAPLGAGGPHRRLPLFEGSDYLLFALAASVAFWSLGVRPRRRGRWVRHGAIAWAVALAVLIGGWFATNAAGRRATADIRAMLQSLVPMLARELEHLGHAQISLDTPPDDPVYLGLIAAQRRWVEGNRFISDVYTFRRRADGALVLLVDAETDYDRDGVLLGEREQRTAIGEVYPDHDPYLRHAFDGFPSFSPIPITDRWGTWVTAYAPVRDAQGRVEAVVGVDYDASRWTYARMAARLTAMGYIAVLLALIGCGAHTIGVLLTARDAARAASRAKGQFLANMSHELRTPLTAILGYTDLLARHDLPPAERREHVQTIRRNGEHLLTIINDVLDFSKIDAGAMAVEKIECDPWQVASDVVTLMQPRADARGISLELRRGNDVPHAVSTDPTRLRQILINLVGNAIKFTNAGWVRVTLSVSGPAAGPETHLTIEVADSGIGIDPETLPMLFQPFTQADASMTRRFGGSGLGLTISQRLATLLGGRIDVRSRPGHGSVFSLVVPVEKPEAAPCPLARPAENAGATSLAGVRILVAEDGSDNQRLFRFHLESAGAAVTTAPDGNAAIESVRLAASRGLGFDLVLMDMQMPELDGVEATRRLRREGYAGPIIALTAHSSENDRQRCLGAGCTDFLNKPIRRDALLNACARWAARKAA